MAFHRSGKAQVDLLDSDSEVKLLDFKENYLVSPFIKLDFLLQAVGEKAPDSLDAFVERLTGDLDALVGDEGVNRTGLDTAAVLGENEMLKRYPELAEKALVHFLAVLTLGDKEVGLDEAVKVRTRDLYRSYILPQYAQLGTLMEVLGREEGANLYKWYITTFHLTKQAGMEETDEDIPALYKHVTENAKPDSIWVMARGLIGEGKYAFKQKNCPLVEALEDLPDREMVYLVCCYGDYAKFRRYNKHFLLTMEHTIAEGDPYCTRVLHDVRVDWDLRHPPKAYWEEMG